MKDKINQIIRHGAYGIVLSNGKILLSKKKSGPYQGLWGLPGGGFEFGETPEDTVKRELKEETSLIVNQLEFLEIATSSDNYFKDGEAYGFHQVGHIYNVLSWTEQKDLVPEEDCQWVALNELNQQELTPFAKHAVALLNQDGSWRPSNNIRGKTIGLANHNGRLLVCQVLDDHKNLKGWCPPGGGIEFGETAEAALKREIREELECNIQIVGGPIVCENIFDHHGVKGHEIVFAFPIIFDNPEIYEKSRWQFFENKGSSHWIEWVDIVQFQSGKEKFYPEAIFDKWFAIHND